MQEFEGKGAFITGAASGIGLGMARAFAKHGMKVAMADIERDALDAAVADVRTLGGEVLGVPLDVSDRAAVQAAADQVAAAFEKIHVLCNNAGVGGAGKPLDETPGTDWDWVLGVNLHGVINGLLAFLPLIKAHGEGGHVVNTSSMSGHRSVAGRHQGVYVTTKFALVGMSETLSQDLAAHNIGVTVLCPSFVRTNLPEAGRNRPAKYGGPFAKQSHSDLVAGAESGRDPNEVGEEVLEAIEANELYLFTDATQKDEVVDRHRRVEAALDRAAVHGT